MVCILVLYSGGRVFLLDAYFAVIVLYKREDEDALENLPFPPPHESKYAFLMLLL